MHNNSQLASSVRRKESPKTKIRTSLSRSGLFVSYSSQSSYQVAVVLAPKGPLDVRQGFLQQFVFRHEMVTLVTPVEEGGLPQRPLVPIFGQVRLDHGQGGPPPAVRWRCGELVARGREHPWYAQAHKTQKNDSRFLKMKSPLSLNVSMAWNAASESH